jgi:hypothetical protein
MGLSAPALQETQVITVPQLLRTYGRGGIDILKLDIEGGELELLTERPEWINTTRVIFAELHDRIAPGASAAFAAVSPGRKIRQCGGEKILSVLNEPA